MKKICVLFVFLLVCACSWRSPNAEFYVMNSEGINALSSRVFNIAVSRVEVPDMLDRTQLVVYDKDSNRVDILEFHRWAENFPDILQNTVINDLQAMLPNSYVQRSYFGNEGAKYSVNIEINQIKAYRNDKVMLDVWWQIQNANGKVVKRKQANYETLVKGETIADLVSAESATIHQMSSDIVKSLLQL